VSLWPHRVQPDKMPDRRRRTVSPGTALLYLIVLGFSTVGLAVAFNQNSANHHQAVVSKQVATRSKHVADRLAVVVRQIQAEREHNIRDNCLDQNDRHDRTVLRLKAIARDNHLPAQRIEPTITLIDALAPHRDCKALVASQVKAAAP
jgi:hypothetical protein